MRYRDGLEVKFVLMGKCQERRNRLLAVWAVVKKQSNSLALKFLDTADFFRNMLDHNICSRPISPKQRKIPHEH